MTFVAYRRARPFVQQKCLNHGRGVGEGGCYGNWHIARDGESFPGMGVVNVGRNLRFSVHGGSFTS